MHQYSSALITNQSHLILFISIPEHFSGSSKLRQKHYFCLYNFPVCISIEQSRGSPESKECLGIDIQNQKKMFPSCMCHTKEDRFLFTAEHQTLFDLVQHYIPKFPTLSIETKYELLIFEQRNKRKFFLN